MFNLHPLEPNAIESAKTPPSFYIDAVFLVCVDGQRIAHYDGQPWATKEDFLRFKFQN